jgi:diaminopimelate epimerase
MGGKSQQRKRNLGQTMQLRFTKMHGAGNDFVMIDLISQYVTLRPKHVRRLADRHLGVGCDQVLVVEAPTQPEMDFRYRIYNADGNEVEQCGNGARCFARFVREKKLTTKKIICVETAGGPIELRVQDGQQVEVNMGPPKLEPADIPYLASQRAESYELDVEGRPLEIGAVSMGNPHAILRVDDIAKADLEHLGPIIENSTAFPEQANVGFWHRRLRSRCLWHFAGLAARHRDSQLAGG